MACSSLIYSDYPFGVLSPVLLRFILIIPLVSYVLSFFVFEGQAMRYQWDNQNKSKARPYDTKGIIRVNQRRTGHNIPKG
jgi:hypothetical protein